MVEDRTRRKASQRICIASMAEEVRNQEIVCWRLVRSACRCQSRRRSVPRRQPQSRNASYPAWSLRQPVREASTSKTRRVVQKRLDGLDGVRPALRPAHLPWRLCSSLRGKRLRKPAARAHVEGVRLEGRAGPSDGRGRRSQWRPGRNRVRLRRAAGAEPPFRLKKLFKSRGEHLLL